MALETGLRPNFSPDSAINVGSGIKIDGKPVNLRPGDTTAVKLNIPRYSELAQLVDNRNTVVLGTGSRWVQSGGVLSYYSGQNILEASREGATTLDIDARNYSKRPLFLEPGAEVGVLYTIDRPKFLVGEEVENLVRDGKIQVSGDYGVDWKFWRNPRDKSRKTQGIEFAIDPDSRFFIPRHDRNKPVVIGAEKSTIYQYRPDIDAVLEPVTAQNLLNNDYLHVIAQTKSSVFIDESLDAIIDPTLPVKGNTTHTNAYLVYGGSTNWNVRVEHMVIDGEPADKIVMRYTRKHFTLIA